MATNVRVWRGTTLPNELVDGRIYYLYKDNSRTSFTIYMDHGNTRSKLADSKNLKVFKLASDQWTDKVMEGDREWVTQSIDIVSNYTDVIHAIPCGSTLNQLPTEAQERAVLRLRGFLDVDDKKIVFYSPFAPTIDLYIAIEGVI